MDKLADGKDIENFEKIQKDVIKKSFDDGSVHEIEQRILNLRIPFTATTASPSTVAKNNKNQGQNLIQNIFLG